jgi:D-glycero-alpha-D-manno-heptose 1-phosphate guanylyltransferase
MNAFGESYKNVPVNYAIEETPLGTGGAIRFALQEANDDSVLVLNGDTFLEADLKAMLTLHKTLNRPITIAVTKVPEMARYGGVLIENGHVEGFIEKGITGAGFINAGIYAMDRNLSWPETLPQRFSFESDFLSPLVKELHPAAFTCAGRFLDIGIPEDLDRAESLVGGKDDFSD